MFFNVIDNVEAIKNLYSVIFYKINALHHLLCINTLQKNKPKNIIFAHTQACRNKNPFYSLQSF